MKHTYKIDIRHQLRSCRQSLFYVYMSVFGIGFTYFMFHSVFNWWTIFLVGSSLFWLAVVVTLPFHVPYLMKNWSTKLLLDDQERTVTIEDKGRSLTYRFEDIRTERHLGGHHKPGMIKSYRPVPFDIYGYVKIKTKDNNVFYITSLMSDPFEFPLAIDSTNYGLPFIGEEVSDEEIRRRNEQYWEGKIKEFMETFDKLSDESLVFKIENKENFEKEAVEAARRIMETRKKITTANKVHNQWRGSV